MHMTMHEDDIIELMETIKKTFRPENVVDKAKVHKAMQLVRIGTIRDDYYHDANRTFYATLEEVDESNSVSLNFEKGTTTCSCEHPHWCVHGMTIVFFLYGHFHSLTEWMDEWRRMETEQMKYQMNDRTPEAWHHTLAQLMNPIRVIGLNENPAVFIHKFSLIDQKAATLYPFEWEWKPVFDLYYRLHALEAAWPYLSYHLANQQNSFSYGKWYVKNWLTEQFSKIEDLLRSLSSKRQLFELDPFYNEIREMIRVFAIEQTGLFTERFRLYRAFWQSLFAQKLKREQELAKLAEVDSPVVQPLFAYFYVIEQRYDDLAKTVATIQPANIGAWFPLADVAEYEDDSKALSIIMQALIPFIPEYAKSHIPRSERAMFARRIDGLLEMADFPEDEREKMFFIYGDTGVDVYADFLVERERFKEWAALMHRYRVPHEIAEAGGLKLALKDDPVAIFPLLHFYAMNFISERNRQSYRRAVNIFRKMKNGAKKSGKHEFWNQYIETIRTKNKRLRALMEEIEKGNLTL